MSGNGREGAFICSGEKEWYAPPRSLASARRRKKADVYTLHLRGGRASLRDVGGKKRRRSKREWRNATNWHRAKLNGAKRVEKKFFDANGKKRETSRK